MRFKTTSQNRCVGMSSALVTRSELWCGGNLVVLLWEAGWHKADWMVLWDWVAKRDCQSLSRTPRGLPRGIAISMSQDQALVQRIF